MLWWSVSSIGLQQGRCSQAVKMPYAKWLPYSWLRTFRRWKQFSTIVWYNKVSMIIRCLSNSISISLVCKLLNLFYNLKCVLVTRQMVLDMVVHNCTQGDGFQRLTPCRGDVVQVYRFGKVRIFSYLKVLICT